jgi:hypothetical protein
MQKQKLIEKNNDWKAQMREAGAPPCEVKCKESEIEQYQRSRMRMGETTMKPKTRITDKCKNESNVGRTKSSTLERLGSQRVRKDFFLKKKK